MRKRVLKRKAAALERIARKLEMALRGRHDGNDNSVFSVAVGKLGAVWIKRKLRRAAKLRERAKL
jgi:hypothetical protein